MTKENQKEIILLKDLGGRFATEKSKKKRRFGLYRCYCGKEFEAQIQSINNSNTKSCGCLKNTHNLSNHRLYPIWNEMVQRCNNPKRKAYKHYGLRGITVCNEWLDINNFINDMYPSYKEGLTIDRIDSNGNYEKANCRWASREIQQRNKRLIQVNNTSGYKGVSFKKKANKFQSYITVNSKNIHIGMFKTKLEAAKAYDKYIIDNNLEHTLNGVIL